MPVPVEGPVSLSNGVSIISATAQISQVKFRALPIPARRYKIIPILPRRRLYFMYIESLQYIHIHIHIYGQYHMWNLYNFFIDSPRKCAVLIRCNRRIIRTSMSVYVETIFGDLRCAVRYNQRLSGLIVLAHNRCICWLISKHSLLVRRNQVATNAQNWAIGVRWVDGWVVVMGGNFKRPEDKEGFYDGYQHSTRSSAFGALLFAWE